jgi:hypothetical protein
MAVTTPEWLTAHGAELRPNRDGTAYTVHFAGEPQYLLMVEPAGGQFACRVSQAVNGKRLDGPSTYPSVDDAIRGGLGDLRKALGW